MSENAQAPESPFVIERLMRDTRRQYADEDFASEADFREQMHKFVENLPVEQTALQRLESLEEFPAELAQELAFQAFESADQKKADELTRRALEIDPECVDALAVRAFLDSENAAELIEALEHAATVGENVLGEEFFAEYMGDFWPLVEARPYLRTIKQLAEVLWTVGRRFDAVEHYINLLDLDPEDHTGNSVLLLGCYLAMGEVQRSWDLLEEYDDDSAIFKWGWVLCLLMARSMDEAEDSLRDALDINPYVAPHLLGMAEPVEGQPAVVTIGSEEEAQICYQIIGEAWEHHPEPRMWLHQQLVDMGMITLDEDDDPAH